MGLTRLRNVGALLFSLFLLFSGVTSHDIGGRKYERRQESTSVMTFAPIPTEAAGPEIPEEGYRTQPLGQGGYMVTDGEYQGLFFVTTRSVVVVDAPPSLIRSLLKVVSEVTTNPITHLVYSHSHADHIAGGPALVEDGGHIEVIAHKETDRILREDVVDDPAGRLLPTRTFSKKYNLKVENLTLELAFPGENHTPDNIFIWAPAQRVLMLVDVVFPGWAPFRSLAFASSVTGFIRVHDQALEYPFETFVGGHVNRAGTRKDVENQREYIQDLYTNCAEAIVNSGDPNNTDVGIANTLPPVAAANPGNGFAVFRTYYDSVANFCGAQTTTKWLGRLAAVDVFEYDHASLMVAYLRVIAGVLGPFGLPPATD